MHRVLVLSDTHCGSVSGLTPPGWGRADCPWLSPFWDWFTSTLKQIGPVDDLIMNGDTVDGEGKKGAAYHLNANVKDQQEMTEEIVDQVKADRRYFVRGTGFHTDSGLCYEDAIAEAFNTKALDDLRLEINGRRLHARHVAGRSDTPYGQGTQIAKELTNELMQGSFEGYEPADLIIRSHVHYHYMVGVGDGVSGWPRIAFTTPCLQLRGPKIGPYVRNLRTWLYHVGMTLIEIEKTGEIFVRPVLFPIDRYMDRSYTCLTKDAA